MADNVPTSPRKKGIITCPDIGLIPPEGNDTNRHAVVFTNTALVFENTPGNSNTCRKKKNKNKKKITRTGSCDDLSTANSTFFGDQPFMNVQCDCCEVDILQTNR